MLRSVLLVSALVSLVACRESRPAARTTPPPTAAKAPPPALQAKIDQFVPVRLFADIGHLPGSEQRALVAIIDASRLLEPVFDRQAYANNPELRQSLARDTSPEGRARAEYFGIMRGPWDRQDDHAPFAIDEPRPPGAGFYPENLTRAEFEAYLDTHPDEREALTSLFTVVRRRGNDLVAIPYSEAYAEWLVPAAAKLREAASYTQNASLARFLNQRADALLADDYYESDKSWMDLDSPVEVTIGPYETYEDSLMGLKASFESFVTVADPEASRKLARLKALLPAMEDNLPVPDAMKTVRGAESPIRVVDLVFSAGDARKSVQTIAFNLPNDERVRKEKGAKKVLLRNLIMTKFDEIMRPIGERILDPSQVQHLSSDAFFNQTLFHELSHSLGPAFTTKNGKKVEVRLALGASYSPLEEAKADVMGAYNILYMIERGDMPESMRDKLLVSYFAGLFRSVRFGVSEAHGLGAALQINRYLEEGAATFDPSAGRFTVHPAKLEQSIEQLVHDIVVLQHTGDAAAVQRLFQRYGKVTPSMQAALASVDDVPVDVRPIYPLAGEGETTTAGGSGKEMGKQGRVASMH